MSERPPLMNAATRLRRRLDQGGIVAAPGAQDALTARLVAASGFEAVYMTGLGATASRLGQPDLGLMTQTEMADCARAMVRAVPVPVIADADAGYGGPLNMARTVEEYIQAGVAALHIEDQRNPKQCGVLAGAQLVGPDEACARLSAAVETRSRSRSDIVLIGRTDALKGEGLDAALARARAYGDTGVDLLFVDGVTTRAQIEAIAAGLDGPKVVSVVDGTDAAGVTLAELDDMGFSMALYAVTTLFAAMSATKTALDALHRTGRPAPGAYDYAAYADVVSLAEFQDFAHRFETTEPEDD
ncbi:isocitrate lyase/PEP mutase family protein [Psychromarinibacter sp. C21-152]|uniref:Isocitrate lyase/PEP mutase family protein n=1 Tax=Psychromarinibacter sediminicola TaxID=3033385 RepID=A0AAE3NP46_9RHOB|nr:isocitrate lyase/PEP mutase family protein [Psychromarinibacter sediminicola]MDF0599412.1 isocitrate lyase/PEP mutase family protein [Psychromarinibacter sediminicola]